VRTAAAESLPFLLECARIRGPDYLTQMWQFICPELLKAVDSEPELDVKAEHMHAVAQVCPRVLFGVLAKHTLHILSGAANTAFSLGDFHVFFRLLRILEFVKAAGLMR